LFAIGCSSRHPFFRQLAARAGAHQNFPAIREDSAIAEPRVVSALRAKCAELARDCFDILRRASAPIFNRGIALVFMTARGMDTLV
jgi:hypothetical protein